MKPAFGSLFQLYFYSKRKWLKNDHQRAWLSKYSTVLLLLSIVTGSSFAAVAVLNSYLFKLEIFDMGLTQKEIRKYNTRRIYSIVMFEVCNIFVP